MYIIKKIKYFALAILLLSAGCHYHQDKLIIKNNSNKTICYHTLTKSVNDGEYYEISGGGEIEAHNTNSPPVRGSIQYSLENEQSDKNLYVIFFDCKLFDFVVKDMTKSVESGKFQVNKYSSKELIKADWKIKYTNK